MKVFIIDDEQVHIFITLKKLVTQGLSEEKDIKTFLSAKDALTILYKCGNEDLPDIMLLDINMPEMSGWQFLEVIEPFKSRFKERCRIYILTSSLTKSDENRAQGNSLVAGFIRKPISNEELRKISTQN